MTKKRKRQRSTESFPLQPKIGRLALWWAGASIPTRISVIGGIIITITGSIVGIAHALPIIEPYWYVAQYELRLVQDRQAVATDRQTLFQLQQFLANAEKDPKAAQSPTAQTYIGNLKKQIDETEKRLDKAAKSK